MLVSVLAGLGGIALAWFMYCLKPGIAPGLASRFPGLYRVLFHKYYVDEFYQRAIVQPALWLARSVLLKGVDTRGIEGVINGVPHFFGTLAQRLRLLQDSAVSHYLAWMGGGVLLLMALLLVR